MKIAVVVFPGSNSDWDALHTARDVLGAEAHYVFHKESQLGRVDAVIIPGGFSYGDYLRTGAIAGFSPIAPALRRFAEGGGPILGICNGFQILTEMGLLPGALTRNQQLRFICKDIWLRVEAEGPFTSGIHASVIRLPIAHAEGRYHCDKETLTMLEAEGRIAFRYCDPDGSALSTTINGSVGDIAGIYNGSRNILGMMPHPERASENILGNSDGLNIFRCLEAHLARQTH